MEYTMFRNARMKGSFVGLAIGDALGTTLEFTKRDTVPYVQGMEGGGPFNLEPGEWTDDTSMALCVADSLTYCREFDPLDMMRQFCQWYTTGYMSHNEKCFDIGVTTRLALDEFIDQDDGNPFKGSIDKESAGNGSIMRLAPIPIFFNKNKEKAIEYAVQHSRLTHAADDCILITTIMTNILFDLYNGKSWEEVGVDVNRYKLIPRSMIKSSGYVIDTFEAACWAISNSSNFKEALLLAVNLADDADTVGAVTGQLAGALYGYGNIPDKWLCKLTWRAKIEQMYNELIKASDEVN